MQNILNISRQKRSYYGLQLFVTMALMLLLLAYTSFYLMQNYFPKSFFDNTGNNEKIYFLQSDSLQYMYEKYNMDYKRYQTRVKYFQDLCRKNGYEVKNISAAALSGIDKHAKLIALDEMSLSSDEIEAVNSFVSNGGRIIFNFTSGFLTDDLKYRNNNLVTRITGLQLDKKTNTIKQNEKSTAYIFTKLLSPLAKYLQNAKALELTVYDPLPIFTTTDMHSIDSYLTVWGGYNYINIDKEHKLSRKESGVIWHGNKQNGKWIYFSFPSYVFIGGDKDSYSNLFKGMLEYLNNNITSVVYPYIDAKNAIFISEDTEYKFENLEQFFDVSLKNKFPVTAFCLAGSAQKHKELMKKISHSPYLEIGSHSFTHKKIIGESDAVYKHEILDSKTVLENLTGKKIIGFRPPREEIDQKMIQFLLDGGYKYILNKGENRLYPYFHKDILIIPRHGTDDYSYLINLDFNSSQILRQMKNEATVITNLNGIYTLSTHTHLMSFGSNINITDKFMQYVTAKKEMIPMNGEMLYTRMLQKSNISLETTNTSKKLLLSIANNNNDEIKNLHIELYADCAVTLKNIESEIIGIKTKLIQVTPHRYTLIIDSITPKSQIVLFVNYDKNN